MSPAERWDLTVDLSTPRVSVKPGGEATVEVTIRNISQLVQHYQASVVGLPSDELWATDQEVIKLRPGESGTISVTLHVPADAHVMGGDYLAGVLVRSPYQPEISRAAELDVTIESVTGTSMSVQPEMVEHRTSGDCAVTLQNQGNVAQMVTVTAFDDQARARFTLFPQQQWVPAGGQGYFRVAWEVPGFLTGQPKTSTITVEARAGEVKQGDARVTFVQKPRIPMTAFRAVGMVVGVAVVAGAIILGGVLSGRFGEQTSGPGDPTTQPPTEASTAPQTVPPQATTPGTGQSSSTGSQPPAAPGLTVAPTAPRVGGDITVTAATTEPITSWIWRVADKGNNIVATAATAGSFTWIPKEAGDFTLTLVVATAGGQTTVTQPLQVAPLFVDTVTEEIALPAGTTTSHDVSCATGRKPVSGGVAITQGNNVTIVQSGPTTDGWNVVLRNQTGTGSAEVSAVCLDPVPGMSVQRQEVNVAGEDTAQIEAACPGDQVVLGGGAGFVAEDGDQPTGLIRESWPDRANTTNNNQQWRYWRAVVEPQATSDAQVWAICGTVTDHQVAMSGRNHSGTGQADLNLTCSRGTLLSAGAALDRRQQTPATGSVRISSSAPTTTEPGGAPEGWQLSVDYSLPTTRQLNSYAVCVQAE